MLCVNSLFFISDVNVQVKTELSIGNFVFLKIIAPVQI